MLENKKFEHLSMIKKKKKKTVMMRLNQYITISKANMGCELLN